MRSAPVIGLIRRAIFPPGASAASPPLVFIALVFVGILQLPGQYLMAAGLPLLGIVVNEVVGVAGVPAAIARWQRLDLRRLFPRRMPRPVEWLLLTTLMLGAVVLMDYATWASELVLPLPEAMQQTFDRLMAVATPFDFLFKLAVLCLLPGICEEIFFRGFCQVSLSQSWGRYRGLAAAALIFALLHGNPYYMHLLFLLGMLFGWIFLTAGTLYASIYGHFLNNAWTFVTHALGVSLPIEGRGWALNAAIATGALALLIGSMAMLRKISRRREHPLRRP